VFFFFFDVEEKFLSKKAFHFFKRKEVLSDIKTRCSHYYTHMKSLPSIKTVILPPIGI